MHEELLAKVEAAGQDAEDRMGRAMVLSQAQLRSQMIVALEAQVHELTERLNSKTTSLEATSERLVQLEKSAMSEADAARDEIEALKRTIERKEREIKSSELAATASAERSEAENDRLRGKVDMLEEQLRVQDEALEEVRHSGSDARNALEKSWRRSRRDGKTCAGRRRQDSGSC